MDIRPATAARAVMIIATSALLVAASGCVTNTTDEDANVGVNPADYPNLRIAGEPNDTFDEPVDIVLDDADQGWLQGSIRTPDDVDVYVVEGLDPGDRIKVDVTTHDSGLDAYLAIFDEAGLVVLQNDDRSLTPLLTDPFLNDILRRSSSAFFLVIARAPLGPSNSSGDYEVLISIVRDGVPPAPAGQIVLLDFDGGTVTIPGDTTYTVDNFDTSDISASYVGWTNEVKTKIIEIIADNYEGFDLDLRRTPEDAEPAGNSFSRVLFGGFNARAFGISQAVDFYNANPADEAIVFTELFSPPTFGFVPGPSELAAGIANVASHELGHLLGLSHVANIKDIMDTTGAATTLLDDQGFLSSPLDATIFPIGSQDSWLFLSETLGLTP